MEDLKKRREDLFREKVELRMRLNKVEKELLAVEVHISNGRYEQNKREEEK